MTAKGRIYINNLEEGSYKLVSNDSKEIEFIITESGKINGNILENTNEKGRVSATAFAYLIITIQTGMSIIKYVVYIILIIIIACCIIYSQKISFCLSHLVPLCGKIDQISIYFNFIFTQQANTKEILLW